MGLALGFWDTETRDYIEGAEIENQISIFLFFLVKKILIRLYGITHRDKLKLHVRGNKTLMVPRPQ